MHYLTKEYWRNFKKDGKLFEKLSKTLIEYEFNVKDFVVMGGPNDEGSDVRKRIELLDGVKTEIWAQCKYHSKSLSFNDISYTLLMAYIRNTNQILVFSYSKVTKDFIRLLDEYRLRTGKSVIIYSDDKLEKLIFKHKEKLKREHDEYFEEFPKYIEENNAIFRYDYQVFVNGVNINDKNSIINLNSICEVVITVTNETSELKRVKINEFKNKVSKNFVFLGNVSDFSQDIPAFESHTFVFYIKLSKFINSTSLPSFMLIYNNQQKKISSKLKISCRWLADTTLIGKKYYRAIDIINTNIKTPNFTLSVVYGKSGVGKRRILKEASSQGIICNKKIISIDSDKKIFSCNAFMELLSSQITQLPFFNTKIDFLSDCNNNIVSFASRILYKQNIDFSKEWETCSNFLITALMQEKYILILDNLQHFDKVSLKIIEKTIAHLSKCKTESNILLGINTDYVYEGSYFYEFFYRLKSTASNNTEICSVIELKGFEQDDAELYIRECLSYRPDEKTFSIIDYEKTIKKITQHCNNNPFYLQHYLLYLEQEDIIRFGDHTLYYFHDIEKFLKSFQDIPLQIESLISLREKAMIKDLKDDSQKNYVYFIQLLNITKSLPQDLFYEIINDISLLDKMFNLGFISFSDDNIVPIHSFYTLYFNVNYPVDSISDELLEKFYNAITKLNYQQIFPLPFYWSKYRLNTINATDASDIAVKLSLGNYDCVANQFCFDALCRVLNKNIEIININNYIKAYSCLCAKIDESIGLKVSV